MAERPHLEHRRSKNLDGRCVRKLCFKRVVTTSQVVSEALQLAHPIQSSP